MSEKRWSKRAMQCHRCPENGASDGSKGCPFWMEIFEELPEPTTVKACVGQQVQRYWFAFLNAAGAAQSAAEQARNRATETRDVIVKGMARAEEKAHAEELDRIRQDVLRARGYGTVNEELEELKTLRARAETDSDGEHKEGP